MFNNFNDDSLNHGTYNVNSYKRNFNRSSFVNPGSSNGSSGAGKPPKMESFVILVVVIGICCAILGGIFGSIITNGLFASNSKSRVLSYNPDLKIDDSYKSNVEAIADKCLPSVVGIRIKDKTSKSSRYSWWETPESSDSSDAAEGSGVIYRSDGYIVTNYHVVESALLSSGASIEVFLYSDLKNPRSASIIGYDAEADIAVIKIDEQNLNPIEFADSDALRPGQSAVVIGNPAGIDFAGSLSQGIVSGLDRKIKMDNGAEMHLIQTDAAVNPGNSGGVMVDGTGKAIGIVNSKLSSVQIEGMGFAIPINCVKTIADRSISNEGKPRPVLGIKMDNRFDSGKSNLLSKMRLPAGVVVNSVNEGSVAAEAGIKSGDIITKVAGKPVSSTAILGSVIFNRNVGDTISLEIYRITGGNDYMGYSGETITIEVTLKDAKS